MKFATQTGNSKEQLYWGRCDIDGAPYKGAPLPPMSEEELEERLVKVAEPHVRIFDLHNSEDVKEYTAVLDKIANGAASLLHREHLHTTIEKRDGDSVVTDVHMKVYIEWAEWCMIDGKPESPAGDISGQGGSSL